MAEGKEEKKADVVVEPPKEHKVEPMKPAPLPSFDTVVLLNNQLKDKELEALDEIVLTAFKNFTVEREIASYIKAQYDGKFAPTWHCIVGI